MEKEYNIKGELVSLSDKLPQQFRIENQAAVLYLPGAAACLIGDDDAANKLY